MTGWWVRRTVTNPLTHDPNHPVPILNLAFTPDRFSVHTDEHAAEHANDDPSHALTIYCELTLPASHPSAEGRRVTYDVTDLVGNSFPNDVSWSVFDSLLKKDSASTLPPQFKERQVGAHGDLKRSNLRLQAVAYVRSDELMRAARCMEAQECDATTKIDGSNR